MTNILVKRHKCSSSDGSSKTLTWRLSKMAGYTPCPYPLHPFACLGFFFVVAFVVSAARHTLLQVFCNNVVLCLRHVPIVVASAVRCFAAKKTKYISVGSFRFPVLFSCRHRCVPVGALQRECRWPSAAGNQAKILKIILLDAVSINCVSSY